MNSYNYLINMHRVVLTHQILTHLREVGGAVIFVLQVIQHLHVTALNLTSIFLKVL